jgi:hypothetical protein
MATPPKDNTAALIKQLTAQGYTVTKADPKAKQAIAPTKSTGSYKAPAKYDPFPNKGAGMGARTKPWSQEAQAIGQGSAKGVTGQRPAQQGNTMQGGFTRGPGGMPQRSGPPLGRPMGAPAMPGQGYTPSLNPQQVPTTWPNGAPRNMGPLAGAGQMPNSPMLPQQGPEEWRPPMTAPLPSAHRGMIELGPPGSIGAQGPEEEQRGWNPWGNWTLSNLLRR